MATVKDHVSFRISAAVTGRLRSAVRHLRGAPLFLSLDGFVEETLEKAVRSLEAKHNGGKPYPRSQRKRSAA